VGLIQESSAYIAVISAYLF